MELHKEATLAKPGKQVKSAGRDCKDQSPCHKASA